MATSFRSTAPLGASSTPPAQAIIPKDIQDLITNGGLPPNIVELINQDPTNAATYVNELAAAKDPAAVLQQANQGKFDLPASQPLMQMGTRGGPLAGNVGDPTQATAVTNAAGGETPSMVAEATVPRQNTDMANERLADPSVTPNLLTDALNTMAWAEDDVRESTKILGFDERYAAEEQVYNSGESNFKPFKMTGLSTEEAADEASTLMRHARHVDEKYNGNSGIFTQPAAKSFLEQDLGVSQMGDGELASGLVLTTAGTLHSILTKDYKKHIVQDPTAAPEEWNPLEDDQPSIADEPVGKKTKAERDAAWNQTLMTDQVASEPVIGAILAGVAESMGRLFAKKSNPNAPFDPVKVSPESASIALYSMYEDGFIELGKDKHGRSYFYLSETGQKMARQTRRATLLYDPGARHRAMHEPIIRSLSAPAVGGMPSDKQAGFMKDGRIDPKFASWQETAGISFGSVGVGVDIIRHEILRQAAAFIKEGMVSAMADGTQVPDGTPHSIPSAYSTSPYTQMISDLSKGKFIDTVQKLTQAADKKPGGVTEKDRRDIAEEIRRVNEIKLTQMHKHINEYMDGNRGKGPRFDVYKTSQATKRLFGTATDINVINFAGDIRAGTDFGNKMRIIPSKLVADDVARVKLLAKRVYSHTGAKGMAIGHSIHRALMALSEQDRALLGAMYQISKSAEELGLHTTQFGNRPSPDVYIRELTPEVFNRMASFGKVAVGWANNLPRDLSANPSLLADIGLGARSLGELFTKKEWSSPLSNAVMAYNMQGAGAVGATVELSGVIESDASQSNAAIIALLIGDQKTSAILGNSLSNFEMLRNEFSDLRTKAASTIDQDIDATYDGKMDDEIKTHMHGVFAAANKALGSAFAKAYARGIVVAGLYGKHPDYMFTEAENMLALMYDGAAVELDDMLTKAYKGDREAMLADICMLYSTAMRRHMNDLQGYQRVASAIGAMKAVFNGSSIVKSFGGTEIDIGISHAVPYDDETNVVKSTLAQNNNLGLPVIGRSASGLLAPGDYGRPQSDVVGMRERMIAMNVNIADVDQYIIEYTTFGDKAKKALPVNLIQSGDSFQMAFSSLYAGRDIKGLPLNIKPIHDAAITDASSTLLYLNAYNNVAPYVMASEGKTILDTLHSSLMVDAKAAFSAVKQAGFANIGTRGLYKGLGGYLDRAYLSRHFVDRRAARGRKGTNSSYFKDSEEANTILINKAMDLGYLPPTAMNINKRNQVLVSPDTFSRLALMIMEHGGMQPTNAKSVFLHGDKWNWRRSRIHTEMRKFIDNNKQMYGDMLRNLFQFTNTK